MQLWIPKETVHALQEFFGTAGVMVTRCRPWGQVAMLRADHPATSRPPPSDKFAPSNIAASWWTVHTRSWSRV